MKRSVPGVTPRRKVYGRVPANDAVRWNVPENNTSRPGHTVWTNLHPWSDENRRGNPAPFPDSDGFRNKFEFRGLKRVRPGAKKGSLRNADVRLDCNRR